MTRKLSINLRKRQEKLYEFYYMVYGQMIKKRRLELNYTQEFVAKAICSDTYVSKAENSRVIMGEEQLFRIMEKLDISRDEFGNPEELVHYLYKIIEYYLYGDMDRYQKLMDRVKNYQFHVVIEIIKLGYHILNNNKEEALKISNLLMDYLNSMDDLAFTIYLCFSSIINIRVGKNTFANYLISSTFLLYLEYEELNILYYYTRYIVYGKQHRFVKAEEIFSQLVPKLVNSHNKKFLHEVMVWKALFNEYNNEGEEIKFLENLIDDVEDDDLVDEFLLAKAYNTSNPQLYMKHMRDKESEKYLIALYLCAKQAKDNNDKALLAKYKNEMKDLHYKTNSKIDFNNLIRLHSNDNYSFYKDYLVNTCYKAALSKENIFYMRNICEKVVKILRSRNRYKDALAYKKKLESDIKKIQLEQ